MLSSVWLDKHVEHKNILLLKVLFEIVGVLATLLMHRRTLCRHLLTTCTGSADHVVQHFA